MGKIMIIAAVAVSSVVVAASSADAAKRTNQYTCPLMARSHHAHPVRQVRHQALSDWKDGQ
jgi:hypothetical protein